MSQKFTILIKFTLDTGRLTPEMLGKTNSKRDSNSRTICVSILFPEKRELNLIVILSRKKDRQIPQLNRGSPKKETFPLIKALQLKLTYLPLLAKRISIENKRGKKTRKKVW